jgi:hypothetical protein
MPERKLLDEAWQEFARAVLPRDASAVQRQEMRRAFYGGAFSVLTLMAALGDDSVSEDQGVKVLDQLHRECHAFNGMVRRGRA